MAPAVPRQRRGALLLALLVAGSIAPTTSEEEEDGDAQPAPPPPRRSAQQQQAELYIDASVRKEVDRALRTHLRCEACQAIAFQTMVEFSVAERRSGAGHGKLSDAMQAMALDEYGACTPSNFEEHKLVTLNGTDYLSGHGMVVEENEMAVQIPGNVTVELAMRCVDTTRVLAPAELYEIYMENRLEHALCLEEGYQVCSGGDGGGKKKRKKGRKKKDGAQEWEPSASALVAQLTALKEEARRLEEGASAAALADAQTSLERLRGAARGWGRRKDRTTQAVTLRVGELLAAAEDSLAASSSQSRENEEL